MNFVGFGENFKFTVRILNCRTYTYTFLISRGFGAVFEAPPIAFEASPRSILQPNHHLLWSTKGLVGLPVQL